MLVALPGGNWGFNAGGGIRSDSVMTFTDATINGNSAGSVCGGISGSASTTMMNVTISGNRTLYNAGICVGGPVTNTIIANNLDGYRTSANCSAARSVGTVNSAGYNLSSDGTCGLSGVGRPQAGITGGRAIYDIGVYEFKRP